MAALNGDWKTAESIIRSDASFVNSSVTEERQTALHVAVGAKQTYFVKKLVNFRQTQVSDLELKDDNGNTAFCLAVIAGSVPIAKILLNKVQNLALIRGGQNSIPLFIAVIFGRHDMARFLFRLTENHLDHIEWEHLLKIFFTCIETDMFGKHMLSPRLHHISLHILLCPLILCRTCADLALKLLERYNDLAVARKSDDQTALHMLAGKPSALGSKRPGIVKMLSNSGKFSNTLFLLYMSLCVKVC